MYSVTTLLTITLIAALITFATRLLPFAFFRNKQVPQVLTSLETGLPTMIMVLLAMNCLKNIEWSFYPHGLPEIICIIIVGVLHIYKQNALISILSGTLVYVLLVHFNIFN